MITTAVLRKLNQRAQLRFTGKVVSWHPYERRGRIIDSTSNCVYEIANARAFETVLPTLLCTLDGATVTFEVSQEPSHDRVIVRSKTDAVTSASYTTRPPVDFLNPLRTTNNDEELVSFRKGDVPQPQQSLYAKNIIVDLASLPSDKLARVSGPLVDEDCMPPSRQHKDMRSSRIFDKETNQLLRLKRQLGSTTAAEEALDRLRQEEEVRRCAHQRIVDAENVTGIVLAWSAVHRNGVVMEGITEVQDNIPVNLNSVNGISIIRNVHCFESALPTSQSLLHRCVRFTKVHYAAYPGKFFAEDIAVTGEIHYDASAASIDEAKEAKAKEKQIQKMKRQLGILYDDDDDHVGNSDSTTRARTTPPHGPVYGVITRWSGGQGTVETGDGYMYYIQSAADFVHIMDASAHGVRGAVVQFLVDAESPRFARQVEILSTRSSANVADANPQVLSKPFPKKEVETKTTAEGDTELDASTSMSDFVEGVLVSWSPHEGQGIVHGSDDQRYVLRDAQDHVIDYKKCKHLLQKGRRVKYMIYGTSGRLVCNVIPLETEADEAEMRSAELRIEDPPKLSMDGNRDEAIASPMSTSYWLGRMEKAGYDVSEVKQLQNRAITPTQGEEEGRKDGKGDNESNPFDSEEIMKNDPWWNDPRKNKKLPNSDVTYGQLAMIGPTALFNLAMNAHDPKKMDKMVNKYQSRLTEKQKEIAWNKAKEMAPKYEALVKAARDRDEEPSFYFF